MLKSWGISTTVGDSQDSSSPISETWEVVMPEPADRRAVERLPVSADVACTFIAPVVENFGGAKIKNISMEGIGLVAARRVEAGSLLAITLANPTRGFTKNVIVKVIHSAQQPGGYLVGGTFDSPLTYQELTSLVM